MNFRFERTRLSGPGGVYGNGQFVVRVIPRRGQTGYIIHDGVSRAVYIVCESGVAVIDESNGSAASSLT